ncbi:uncharacterized protein FIBRA_08553 [Fibroporia radiculosa]|uniref:Transmembrane protein n=1 Tax=Fibroporia radiculosa TaxID=599839 RepID=J4I2Y2_9APHY|nr:uncharacterized protein FIBRA_08553 [Fibroporia radiculosa]CCM06302.1 predicted protein [Fibroporia radiculosa]
MASTTILTTLLILTWFLIAFLILVLTLAFFHFKETYKVEVILTCQPTTPIADLTPEWPSNGVQVTSPTLLTPNPFTDLLSEFLDEGGFCYPFSSPLPNVTCRPFLIPEPLDSSNSDAIVLHQFPGPLEVSQASEATPGSYHIAPAQVFPSLSPMNTSSSPNPDSPCTASTDSPSMPPLASDVSDNGSLDHTPNLWLLADIITRPPMGIPINGNPAFGLQWVSTTAADILWTAEPVGNWNQSDKEWEEDTWEYLLTQDDNLLESLWALLQDIKDLGVTDKVDRFRAVDTKIDLLLAVLLNE